MSKRYRIARARGTFKTVVREDAELLSTFGLTLLSVSGGLRVVKDDEVKKSKKNGRPQVNPWDVMEIEEGTWEWLHPLLCRLRELEAQEGHKIAAK